MSRRSITGDVSTRFGDIPHESLLEHDYILLFDFDHSVASLKAQPVLISFRDKDGKRGRHFPDLLVCFHRIGRKRNPPPPWLCECKYRHELADPELRAEFAPKAKAGAAYARQHGMRYRILTDTAINPRYLENVDFLLWFRREPRNEDYRKILERTCRSIGEASPATILEASFNTQRLKMEALPTLWHMVLDGAIEGDLSKPMTMATLFRFAE